ncbi:guanine nucleotide-binding protein-like 1 [Watersipora subatra]|uniref:guanine nucleotide-binding protein-like 1 n=1 Tax=Watersipora subatra TaxID=2589382 RepID=UPI00355C4850
MPRKKPFSGKQKKLQLQAKRQEKQFQGSKDGNVGLTHDIWEEDPSDPTSKDLSSTRASSKKATRDRYKLEFQEESKDELQRNKEIAMRSYARRSPEEMEASSQSFYDPPIMFPVRPPWDHSLTLQTLEEQEHKYFQNFCERFRRDHKLGYVELNLETWRQLWRVLEMSDILLHIIDVRYAPLHFNPELYKYVTSVLGKEVIVILNKCDIVPPSVAIAWKNYLLEEFPKLKVVIFTSYPKDPSTRTLLAKGKQSGRRRKRPGAVGPIELWEVCNSLVKGELNIDSWKSKILDDMHINADEEDSDQSDCEVEEKGGNIAKLDLTYTKHAKYKDGVLTVGCIGYPNVGKSSVINGLMGHKVVSISRTPGHTKHFQTIFLTRNVKLCDCPGLVFPSTAPRAIQVLAGMYPVSQIREPYSIVQYIAERCDLPTILGLRLPADENSWSAYLICDELAELKGFKTARGARTDSYRAANWILRAALEGKVLIYLFPPQYHSRIEYWSSHPDADWLELKQLERLEVAEGLRSRREEEVALSESEESGEETAACSNAFALLSDDS